MENSQQVAFPSPRPTLIFIENLRFIASLAIVGGHCLGAVAGLHPGSDRNQLSIMLNCSWRFGTIVFFLISGYLAAGKLEGPGAMAYLRRRAKSLLVPWFAWYTLEFARYFWASWRMDTFSGLSQPLLAGRAASLYFTHIFDSVLWFVPHLVAGLVFLALLARFRNGLRLGGALAAISLAFALNCWFRWLPLGNHAQAFMAYTFYIWLGYMAGKRPASFLAWVRSLPVWPLAACVVCVWCAGWWEGYALSCRTGFRLDPFNSIRLGNQVFALVLTLLLIKLRTTLRPRLIDDRAIFYGVYLMHGLVLMTVINLGVHRLPGLNQWLASFDSFGWVALEALVLSAIVYCGTVGASPPIVVRCISRLCFTAS